MQEHSPERVSRAGASESKLIGLLSSLPRVKPLRAVLRTGYPGTAPCLVLPEVAPLAANGSGESEFKGVKKKTAKGAAKDLKSITGIDPPRLRYPTLDSPWFPLCCKNSEDQ